MGTNVSRQEKLDNRYSRICAVYESEAKAEARLRQSIIARNIFERVFERKVAKSKEEATFFSAAEELFECSTAETYRKRSWTKAEILGLAIEYANAIGDYADRLEQLETALGKLDDEELYSVLEAASHNPDNLVAGKISTALSLTSPVDERICRLAAECCFYSDTLNECAEQLVYVAKRAKGGALSKTQCKSLIDAARVAGIAYLRYDQIRVSASALASRGGVVGSAAAAASSTASAASPSSSAPVLTQQRPVF